MKQFLMLATLTTLLATTGLATTITFTTIGSTLSCNELAGCVQVTQTSIGGLQFTPVSSMTTATLGIPFTLGVLTATGGLNFLGAGLTININIFEAFASGTPPGGTFSALGSLNFFNNMTNSSSCASCPGVVVGTGPSFLIQVNPTYTFAAIITGSALGIAPAAGSSTIMITAIATAVPEPSTPLPLLLVGVALVYLRTIRTRAQA